MNTAIVAAGGSSLADFAGGIGDAFLVDVALAALSLLVALLFVGGQPARHVLHFRHPLLRRAHP